MTCATTQQLSHTQTRALATVQRAIKKEGRKVTWRTFRDGAPPDPTKPFNPGETVTRDYTVYILYLRSNRKALQYMGYAPNSDVPAGYMLGIIAGGLSFTPALKDAIIDGDEVVAIDWIDPLKPGGVPIIRYFGLLP